MGVKKLKAFCAPLGQDSHQGGIAEDVCCRPSKRYGTISRRPRSERRIFTLGTGGNYETGEERVAAGTLPVKNYLTNLYPEARLMTCQYVRERWRPRRGRAGPADPTIATWSPSPTARTAG